MKQNPQSSSTPPSNPAPPSERVKVILQWLSVILILSAFVTGCIGYFVKLDVIPNIILFVFSLAGAILQLYPKIFSFIWRERKTGIQILVILLLLSSIGLNGFQFIQRGMLSPFAIGAVKSTPTPTQIVGGTRPTSAPSVSTATPPVPASFTQKVAVPSYFDPDSSGWSQMEQSASISSLAIINPDNGPGASQDQNYVDQVTQAEKAGMRIVGYIATGYAKDATRSLAATEHDVDTYYRWYPNLNGILVDEASSDCGTPYSSYYKPLYNYIKQKGTDVTVILNPGTNTGECYMAAADIIVNFDDTYANYVNWSPDPWVMRYSADHFWQIIHATNLANMPQAIVYAKSRHAGWVYVTDRTEPDPFDLLPSYWNDELQRVKQP